MRVRAIILIIMIFDLCLFSSCIDNNGKTTEGKVPTEYEIQLINAEILKDEVNWNDLLEKISGGELESELIYEIRTINAECSGIATIDIEEELELQVLTIEVNFIDYDLCGILVNGSIKIIHPLNLNTTEEQTSSIIFKSFNTDDSVSTYTVHIDNSLSSLNNDANDPIQTYRDDDGEYVLMSFGIGLSSADGIVFSFSIEK